MRFRLPGGGARRRGCGRWQGASTWLRFHPRRPSLRGRQHRSSLRSRRRLKAARRDAVLALFISQEALARSSEHARPGNHRGEPRLLATSQRCWSSALGSADGRARGGDLARVAGPSSPYRRPADRSPPAGQSPDGRRAARLGLRGAGGGGARAHLSRSRCRAGPSFSRISAPTSSGSTCARCSWPLSGDLEKMAMSCWACAVSGRQVPPAP